MSALKKFIAPREQLVRRSSPMTLRRSTPRSRAPSAQAAIAISFRSNADPRN